MKKRFLISGGGVAETELALKLGTWAKEQTGMKAYCVRAYAEALGALKLFGKGVRVALPGQLWDTVSRLRSPRPHSPSAVRRA